MISQVKCFWACASAAEKRQKGFTLIELMITVSIVGILGAIAYPSYQESIRKGRRADALRTLVEAEQYMRRYYSIRDTYKGVTLPASLKKSPKEGDAAYSVQFLVGTALKDTSEDESKFTLRLTRTGSMSEDRCGDLQVDQSGGRSLKNNTTGNEIRNCFPGS